FRFADSFDIFLMVIGAVASVVHGAGLPVLFIFFGELTTAGSDAWFCILFCSLITLLFKSYKTVYFIPYVQQFLSIKLCRALVHRYNNHTSHRQSKHIRIEYFRSILRQDMAFHDIKSSGELNARLSNDVKKIKDGMAEKVSMVLQYTSMSLTGIIVGLFYAWKLALVTLSVSPLLGVASTLMFTLTAAYTERELKAYATAGTIAEEAISAIRTVVAFGCQDKEVDRYTHNLGDAKIVGIKRGFISGFTIGLLYLSMFGMYGLSFWYGTTLVLNGEIAVGDMITTFFNILIAAFALGTAGSYLEAFSGATAAGSNIFDIIDRKPVIDPFSKEGDSPNPDSGSIQLKNVRFTYPSRPEVEILKGVSLTVEHGKTVALVGQSGCGKSTIIQLIQRFYDVQEGSLEVGDKDVSKLNVRKLREVIGVVAQEPILFATSIAENIRWGREGVTNEEIEEAARQANAYNFIMNLPEKFQTLVGERGGQMSGGQKQRIAIARAIVRNPKVLLLDEATSALDTKSESVVQQALEKASAGRTTVVVAHRLSTIRSADKIFAFHEGQIMEEGSHEELLLIKDGVYSNLINMQAGRESEEHTEEKVESPEPDDIGQNFATYSSNQATITSFSRSNNIESKKSGKIGEDDEEEEEEDIPDVSFGRIIAMNKPEWYYMAGGRNSKVNYGSVSFSGCVFAAIAGAADPVNAILFAEVLTVFSLSDVEEQKSKATLYALLFVGVGVIVFIAYCSEVSITTQLFFVSGMELTVRLRKRAFQSLMRQDIAYFDDHRHSPGALCTRLSTDASRVQGCTGVRIGTIIKNFSSLGNTLCVINFFVLYSFIYYPEYKHGKSIRKAMMVGLGYGYSQCVIYFAYAAVFRLGIELVLTYEMTYDNVFKVLTAVIFGAMAVGQNSSFAPDYAEAKVSAKKMFALFDRKPEIDVYSDKGASPAHCKGEITLKSVRFHYPTRPDLPVLKGLDITIKPGQTLALVGQSGCGKSTTVQLLERFYDADEGEVCIDGYDIKKLNIKWVRQQMGLVSQEPMLFNQSIKENILYGDCSRSPTNEEVNEAAKNANIKSFIDELPAKFETSVGLKGGQLSGGQKQRIAIARALIRNPKILLLDEATSALDTESEKIVQEALDAARAGRTSIVVAHRLSTVKNADQIAVVDNGVVVEVGTHEQLIATKGAYF
uniref:Bile salt export pump n=1 Tax=Ciona savignyi TaxID=51511 RepID=H2ZPT0_CIOSA